MIKKCNNCKNFKNNNFYCQVKEQTTSPFRLNMDDGYCLKWEKEKKNG